MDGGRLAEAVLVVGHVLVAAAWFGAMSYSLFVVQPRAERLLDSGSRGRGGYEPFAQTLAAGQRWKVLGLMATLAVTGAGLLGVLLAGWGSGSAGDRGGVWWTAFTVHAALLAPAVVVFARVSWRLWPARLFALPDELPVLRTRFRYAAMTLLVLVGTALVLGVLAQVLRTG